MAYTIYTSKQGDTWASIAWKAYGDVSKMDIVIAENPYIPANPVIPGGLIIRVPILEATALNQYLLPPWKR